MKYSSKARLLLAGAAIMTFTGQAFALDGNVLLGKINAALALQGGSLTAQSVNVTRSNVTLIGAAFNPAGTPKSVPIGTIEMEGVEEEAGGYTIDKVKFPEINASKDGTTITATDLTMSGVTVPADVSTGGLDSILLYDEAHAGPIDVSLNGKSIFRIGETNVTTAVADDDSGVDFDMKLTKLKANLGAIDDPKSRDTVTALGLTSLDGEMTLTGSWTQADGTVDISEYSLDIDKVGRLDFAFSMSGYTLDFMKSAQETAKASQANADKPEAQQAASLAMLGLMQRITFNSAQIKFTDDGITKRGLDFAGKSQGVSGAQMAQMLKGMTPLMLAQFNIPELQNMVSAAVNTYLDKPGDMTITAEPANPVPVPMIVGAAMGAPNTLPQVLGVKVTAND